MGVFEDLLKDIEEYPDFRADPGATANLMSRMREADSQAKADLIVSTLRLIVQLAKSYCKKWNAWEDLEELVQAATLEISARIDKYNPQKPLEAFVHFFARIAFIEHWYDKRTINHTTYRRRLAKFVRQADRELSRDLGREPTLEELSEYLGLDEKKVRELRAVTEFIPVDSSLRDAEDDSAEIAKFNNLHSHEKSPLENAQNSEIRNLAVKHLGEIDAFLLLGYQAYGAKYYRYWYFRLYGEHLREATARKHAERLKARLREIILKKNSQRTLGGDYGFQTAR
jgi:DNA-directed RNA polymerase specialized sigma subunit